ncbi:dihydrofolate reductase, partial [Escherichia coli]|uniref:dihydrofolate reductase n=2 Tax=Escherichia coli TaxID=562 RepID=UPI0020346064
VPAYGPQNDVTLKMPAFEWVHVQLHQQKGMISLSPPTICNSAVFPSIENALKELSKVTDHVYVSGGGQIYNSLIEKADIIHLSTVHVEVEGDIKFPIMPENFNLVFEQFFMSNINYTYQIWKKG